MIIPLLKLHFVRFAVRRLMAPVDYGDTLLTKYGYGRRGSTDIIQRVGNAIAISGAVGWNGSIRRSLAKSGPYESKGR
jgi:hypothetical protein